MSKIFTTRNLLIAGGVGGAVFLFPRTVAKVNPAANGIETPATQAIAKRWNSGGATETHTPGYATQRGSTDATYTQSSPSGPTSKEFQEGIADQKKDDYGAAGKVWNQSHYGTDKGK